MKITKTCIIDGSVNTIDLPITLAEYTNWMYGNQLVQNAFPNLTADEREFLLTGTPPGKWDEFFLERE